MHQRCISGSVESCSSYMPERNPFANWIAGVARIKALDYKRRYAARLLEMSWEEAERCSGKDMMAEISQIEEEFSEETRQMLECLNPQDRELFLKIYVEEENMETVSAQSGMSRPVIYNRLSRGKKKIRRLFSRT